MLEVDVVRISVIVPIYNVKLYIERCVRSFDGADIGKYRVYFCEMIVLQMIVWIFLHYVLEEYPKRREQIKNNRT